MAEEVEEGEEEESEEDSGLIRIIFDRRQMTKTPHLIFITRKKYITL